MNKLMLNTVALDGRNVIVKKKGGGGGSGAVSLSEKDVNFYDYDGTLLHSYSKDEFLQMSSLPELPTREGLICQEWNYNLSDAKEYVEEYGVLDIGATYITDDGKTRLYITIATDGRMDVPLYFSQTVSDGVTVDWGDGNTTQTISGTGNVSTTHTYTEIGDYIITLNPKSGCILGFGHGSSVSVVGGNSNWYRNMLEKAEIGNGVTSIRGQAFTGSGLSSIVIPNGVTSIGYSAFQTCYFLSSIVIPNGVTSIGSDTFRQCKTLSSVVIPNSVTKIDYNAFYGCISLQSIVIPNSVTKIDYDSFNSCYSLSSIVISNSITDIGKNAFYGCKTLSSVVVPNSVTKIDSSAFYYCDSLQSIVIPNSVTKIDSSAFNGCSSLRSVVISNGVTSIGSSAFYYCYCLSSVVVPNSVTKIDYNAFESCSGMAYYDFSQHTTIPTLASTSVFQRIPSDCKIIVPDNLYDSWIAATNWSSYASYIIKKSVWDTPTIGGGADD